MNITLNGQTKEISVANVQDLVAELKLDNIALVAEHNGVILRKEDWAKTPLQENDQLELIKFCGGG
ncbi:MAG: sulfur carrier protein ThiS [Candidatus Margulisbacteria bacterium]|jgi:sulfur carrier protein|nr:sulfur carrier protein ThiS [Candidatus Margulisiibacteriota bacterium]